MSILNKKSKLDRLKTKNAKDLGIFYTTLENMANTNQEITQELEVVRSKKEELVRQEQELTEMEDKNNKLSSKFKRFLNEL